MSEAKNENPNALSYCYSTDSCLFHEGYESREAALQDAKAEILANLEPGETLEWDKTILTGIAKPAKEFLRGSATRIALEFAESMNDWLSDVLPDDEPVKIKDTEAFGLELLDLLDRYSEINQFGVSDIIEHEIIFDWPVDFE